MSENGRLENTKHPQHHMPLHLNLLHFPVPKEYAHFSVDYNWLLEKFPFLWSLHDFFRFFT